MPPRWGTVLKRLLLYSPEAGFMLMPDPKHLTSLSTVLGMTSAKPMNTPITKATGKTRDALELLTVSEKRTYATAVGICMYIGPDRFDIQIAVRSVSPDLATPTRLSMARVRRLAR